MSDAAIQKTDFSPNYHLLATNRVGMTYVSFTAVALVNAVLVSSSTRWWMWLKGKMIFALAFLECFVLLHEAGHLTLFRIRRLNLTRSEVVAALSRGRTAHDCFELGSPWSRTDPP